MLKLLLNSTSGQIDNTFSWMYYPEGATKLRFLGQLIITYTIEKLAMLGFEVISANTDGIEVIVPNDRIEEYYKIVNQCGEDFNLIFEHEIYKKIVYQNVNSYVAIKENGKLKQKGIFVEKPVLGKKVDFLIVPKTINNYFKYNTPIKQTLLEEKNIYLFCGAKKIGRDYKVTYNNEEVQRLNRFYASNKYYLLKERENKKGIWQKDKVIADSGITIYNNKIDDFPNDINYNFYIRLANSIIGNIEVKQKQLSLF